MPLGPNDLKNISLPGNWDATALEKQRTADGASYAQVLVDINDALSALNSAALGGMYGSLVSLTTEAAVEYRVGASNGFEDATEYGTPDAKRAGTTGHMLPIKTSQRMLGWTRLSLPKLRRAQIDSDMASAMQDALDLVQKSALNRIFKSTADTGAANGLGASGSSVPFADGGTADSNYVPVPRLDRAAAFASDHTHYAALNGISTSNLGTAVKNLWEHGHDAPYDLLVSSVDVGSWTGLSTFVARDYGLVNNASTVSVATVGNEYLGVITTNYGPCRLWASGRIPTTYWAVTKSYGQGDARNPLRIRYDENKGFGFKLVSPVVGSYALQDALLEIDMGVGVGEDRCQAVAVFNDSGGSYTNPTIS